MPKKRVFQMRDQDLSAANFTLEARFGESYLIREIQCTGSGGGQSAVVNIGGENMLSIPAIDDIVNLSPYYNTDVHNIGMFAWIMRHFPDVPLLKVAEGEIMTISRATPGQPLTVRVIWEERIEDEKVSFDEPGGSRVEDRLFISLGENPFTVGATSVEEHEIITSLQPPGFEDFPWNRIVPVDKVMHYLGTVVTFASTTPANEYVDGLQVWKKD